MGLPFYRVSIYLLMASLVVFSLVAIKWSIASLFSMEAQYFLGQAQQNGAMELMEKSRGFQQRGLALEPGFESLFDGKTLEVMDEQGARYKFAPEPEAQPMAAVWKRNESVTFKQVDLRSDYRWRGKATGDAGMFKMVVAD